MLSVSPRQDPAWKASNFEGSQPTGPGSPITPSSGPLHRTSRSPFTTPSGRTTPKRATVIGSFVDTRGSPLSMVAVRINESVAHTDDDGQLEMAVNLPGSSGSPDRLVATLRATKSGYRTLLERVRLSNGGVVNLGRRTLGNGATLYGLVVDHHSVPATGITVGVTQGDESWPPSLQFMRIGPRDRNLFIESISNGDGRFILEGVSENPVRLWATDNVGPFSVSRMQVSAHSTSEGSPARIVLMEWSPDEIIAGVVVGPYGEAVADAQIEFSYSASAFVGQGTLEADAQGAFRFAIPFRGTYRLEAHDPTNQFSGGFVEGVMPGDVGVRIVLRSADWLEVHIVEAMGMSPIPATVTVLSPPESTGGQSYSTVEPGLVVLPLPTEDFELVVSSECYVSRRQDSLGIDPRIQTLAIALDEAPKIRGRVISSNGPVSGATITLHKAIPDGMRTFFRGFPLVMGITPEGECVSDLYGNFQLCGTQPDAQFYLRVLAQQLAGSHIGPLVMDDDRSLSQIEVFLHQGCNLTGQVLDASGAVISGAIIGIGFGDGDPITTRSDRFGVYSFERLPSGPCNIKVLSEEPEPDPGFVGYTPLEDAWNFVLETGRTNILDLVQ